MQEEGGSSRADAMGGSIWFYNLSSTSPHGHIGPCLLTWIFFVDRTSNDLNVLDLLFVKLNGGFLAEKFSGYI